MEISAIVDNSIIREVSMRQSCLLLSYLSIRLSFRLGFFTFKYIFDETLD